MSNTFQICLYNQTDEIDTVPQEVCISSSIGVFMRVTQGSLRGVYQAISSVVKLHQERSATNGATLSSFSGDIVKLSNGQMVKWLNGQMVKWPNSQLVKWPYGQMFK